jgi:hypothetical protein
MQCWICGAPADSGEHIMKVTDLRDLFGQPSKQSPLFQRVDAARPELVQGLKSDKLKFATKLCSHCNNARTQRHDRSWEALSTYLRGRQPELRVGEVVRIASAFTKGLRPSMLGVHLYFAKLTGCLLLDGGAPFETQSLAAAILDNRPHADLYLQFMTLPGASLRHQAFVTPVTVGTVRGQEVSAQWYYGVGRLAVHVAISPHIHGPRGSLHFWHPRFSTKTITIGGRAKK